ncbi:MAG TPA: cellulase family glycosylhydrolase [Anaerolineae bacterium]|nr:cellulase family glycosylhydrolase [Anaerolineae bacterium]HOQ97290.1 cellulase family glycosylhydrolase [Anaerolineae bacterium]HOQ97379.1 cellulase family glycosylhydrolase [Anaerolineae bacterium]HPL27344.1 cellulase family glycosylhydrolase [Anaerolineae bacterium]
MKANRKWRASRRWACHAILLALALSLVLSACARPEPTPKPTAEPPATAVVAPSATNTDVPASPVPPTATEAPAAEQTATVPPAGATATPLPNPAPATVRLNSPEYGMQAFLWWRPEVASRDVQLVKNAGFGWIKQGIGWREVELEKGQFNWTQLDDIAKWIGEQQLDLIARLDHQPQWAGGGFPTNGPPTNYQDFGDFVYALASRYKGRFRAYEIWNEPNLAREWGGQPPSPAQYAALLKVAYARIKQADPNAIVVSAGLTPTGTYSAEAMPDDVYLEQLYQAMGGSSAGYFDALGAHAPGYKAPPETSPEQVAADPAYGGQRFFCFRRVEDLRKIMVKYGDTNKQIYILEMGWTSDPVNAAYAWHRVTEQEKADYLVRAYQYAKQNWSPWIGLMSLIYIVDPGWTEQNEQYWWAITDPGYPDVKPRPAYTALQAMPK